MTWLVLLISSSVAAGLALVWLALGADDPMPRIAHPPMSMSSSVTKGYPYKPTVYPVTALTPIGTPPAWLWYQMKGCHPSLLLSPLCIHEPRMSSNDLGR